MSKVSIIEAGQGAIKDAGLEPKDIDGIWIGSCSPSLFVNQEHVGPLGLEVAPEEFRFIPTTRTEGACASSSVAIYNALDGIESGRFGRVLVIGVEKMNLLSTPDMTHALATCSYWPSEGAKGMTFPSLFAEYAKKGTRSTMVFRTRICGECSLRYRPFATPTGSKIPWRISGKEVHRIDWDLRRPMRFSTFPMRERGVTL